MGKLGISLKFFLIISLITLISGSIMTYFQVNNIWEMHYKEIIKTEEMIQNSNKDIIVQAVWLLRYDEINLNVEALKKYQHVNYAEIKLTSGERFFEGESEKNAIKQNIALQYFHNNKNIEIGRLIIEYSVNGINKEILKEIEKAIIFEGSQIIFLGIFMYFSFRYFIIKRLEKIEKYLLNENRGTEKLKLYNEEKNFYDEIDTVAESINTMQDKISEILAKLTESEKMYRLFAENMADVMWMIDAKTMKLTYISPSAENLLGYTVDEIKNTDIEKLVIPASVEPIKEQIFGMAMRVEGYYGKKIVSVVDVQPITKTGKIIDVNIVASLISNEKGEAEYILGVGRDVTAKKKLENELQIALGKAQEANRAKSQFLANMSHELRTPMNGIIGLTELLGDTKLDDDQKDLLDGIVYSGENLLIIINDILDISKIEAGKIDVEKNEFNLENMVNNTVSLMAYSAHKKGIEMVCYVDKKISGILIGDEGKIKQILTNLIGNAVKFTESGTILIEATAVSENESGIEINIGVKDTGIGIPEERQKYIFQPFMQGDMSYTKKYQGTGLGLAISKRLCEMMGGEITLNSLEKKGTDIRFTVVLKRSLNAMPKMKQVSQALNISVLFIDDNELNRKITIKMLEDEGIKAFAVETGKKGLEILEGENDINIILLDVNMPEMDGFTVAEEIKRKFGDRYIILMFTSVDIRDNLEKIKQIGVYDYIIKPVKKIELMNKIRDAVNMDNSEKSNEEGKEEQSEKEGPDEKKSGLSVLVVEDNNVNMHTLIKMIQKCGDFKIYTANDGSEAVTMYEKKMTDYVFMDIQMPVMNGLDATTEIRGISELYRKKPKIIAITAYAMKNDKEKFMAYGMDAVIEKPFKIADIKKIFEN